MQSRSKTEARKQFEQAFRHQPKASKPWPITGID
jgi:hypothetical protein